MFRNNNVMFFGLWKGFDSLFTFNFLSRFRSKREFSSTEVDTNTARVPDQPAITKPESTEQPAATDSIEISKDNPMIDTTAQPTENVYTPENLAKAAEEQPPPAEKEEPVEEQPAMQLVKQSLKEMVNVNMRFNLVDFERAITSLIKKAEEGQLDTQTLNQVHIGLHISMSARARLQEVYQVNEETADQPVNIFERQKTASRTALSSMIRSRAFQANLFYKESLRTSESLRQKYSDGFLRVSRKLAMRYSQDFSLNFRALNLFSSQASALNETDNLEGYLGNTEALVESNQTTGDLIQKFFDAVQGYFDKAESQTIEKIESFFNKFADELGIEFSALDNSREGVVSNINAFFDEVDQAIGSLKQRYLGRLQPSEPTPEIGQTEEPAEPAEENEPVPADQS
jgi:hypothetical protein